jgi:transcription factor E
MQVKFLKSIVEHLTNKQSVTIVDLLVGKKDVNEFIIAKKLGLTINQTRNILYKLSDFGLVSFTRKKDKRKGWYIYFWTLNIANSLNLLEKKLTDELLQLEAQLRSRQEKRYYICKTCNIEVTEEASLLNDFTCSECEQVYTLSNNQEVINKLENEIARLKKEIRIISGERKIEEEKVEKKKIRKFQRAKRKAQSERKNKRKADKAAKNADKPIKKASLKKSAAKKKNKKPKKKK